MKSYMQTELDRVDRKKDATAVEQIRQAHRSAHPGNHNPAWLNSHKDCGVLLAEIDRLRAVNKGLVAALENLIGLSRALMADANRNGANFAINIELEYARAALAKAKGE